jgi:hypothetical protein
MFIATGSLHVTETANRFGQEMQNIRGSKRQESKEHENAKQDGICTAFGNIKRHGLKFKATIFQ